MNRARASLVLATVILTIYFAALTAWHCIEYTADHGWSLPDRLFASSMWPLIVLTIGWSVAYYTARDGAR